jgi:hypothetical protein
MSKARSSYFYALVILLAIACLPVGALAQDGSSDLSFQPAPPITFISPSGAQVYINPAVPDNNGTQVAENVALSMPGSAFPDSSALSYGQQKPQAAPPPPQVTKVTRQIRQKVRRWNIGGRIGAGFSPELFMFGLQSQMGPIFSPRFILRPGVDFGFGELTDMFSLNIEGAYWLRTQIHGQWTPYFGMGPSLNFIHQGASSGDTSFSDFTYKTGFNVFLGAQKGKMFVEMKTSLWSDPAPVLRLFVGYNFF